MDIITKKLLQDFLQSQEITASKESDDFELFCNYSVVANEYNKTFDVKSITTGAGADTGIDGIAIIVNGHLIEDTSEIDTLLQTNGELEAAFLFIQSKTSSNFDTKEMLKFYFGVSDFFSETPKLPKNDDLKKFSELSNYLFDNASRFKENPTCKMFYITTGVTNKDDPNINAVNETSIATINALNLFEHIEANVIGANELGKLYRKTISPVEGTFIFSTKVILPDMEGIDQSFYGVLPFSELKKILIDDNGNLQSIFDDNIRDFQGLNNSVNRNINTTLNGDAPDLFSVLNNGITIVADKIKTSSNKLTITDYQIVNGCQTCNVLYENRNNEKIDKINIPLRLIVTTDEEIKSKITVSTNNQTAVKKEQLTAMSEFQKNLQHYYQSIDGEGKLFYERRAKEFNSDKTIIKKKIITISAQIKSFSAMFNKNPHLVTTYIGTIVKDIGQTKSNIFKKDHQYSPYYMAGLAMYRLDSLFSNGKIDKKYKKMKFYILMLVPMIASIADLPPLNSAKKCNTFCNDIIDKLNDEKLCSTIFQTAIDIINRSGSNVDDKEALKSVAMTKKIIEAYNNEKV